MHLPLNLKQQQTPAVTILFTYWAFYILYVFYFWPKFLWLNWNTWAENSYSSLLPYHFLSVEFNQKPRILSILFCCSLQKENTKYSTLVEYSSANESKGSCIPLGRILVVSSHWLKGTVYLRDQSPSKIRHL